MFNGFHLQPWLSEEGKRLAVGSTIFLILIGFIFSRTSSSIFCVAFVPKTFVAGWIDCFESFNRCSLQPAAFLCGNIHTYPNFMSSHDYSFGIILWQRLFNYYKSVYQYMKHISSNYLYSYLRSCYKSLLYINYVQASQRKSIFSLESTAHQSKPWTLNPYDSPSYTNSPTLTH